MEYVELPIQRANRLLNHGPCILISCAHAGRKSEVLAAVVRLDCFNERLLVERPQARTLHHLGGREFCLPGEVVRKA